MRHSHVMGLGGKDVVDNQDRERDANTRDVRPAGSEQPVVVALSVPDPPARSIEHDPRHEDHVDRSGVYLGR